jgi:hypothetical protein
VGPFVAFSNAIEEVQMKRKHLSILAIALAMFVGTTTARADTNGDVAPSTDKLTVAPAVLTSSGEAKTPITEVQYGRRAYRRGWYGSPYRSYGYGYGYYPRYSYSYYPRSAYYPGYSYGYYPRYGYAYSRPYYGGYYYPRYYTGYRGGFTYSTPGFYGSFYW